MRTRTIYFFTTDKAPNNLVLVCASHYIECFIKKLARSSSYIDLHLEVDSEGRLRTKLNDKRDDFNFPIVNIFCRNITITEYLCHKWPRICFICRMHFPVLSSFVTYYRVCSQSNTTGATSEAGIAYPSRAPWIYCRKYPFTYQ